MSIWLKKKKTKNRKLWKRSSQLSLFSVKPSTLSPKATTELNSKTNNFAYFSLSVWFKPVNPAVTCCWVHSITHWPSLAAHDCLTFHAINALSHSDCQLKDCNRKITFKRACPSRKALEFNFPKSWESSNQLRDSGEAIHKCSDLKWKVFLYFTKFYL